MGKSHLVIGNYIYLFNHFIPIFLICFRSILKYFMQFKDNYFGYFQKFTTMESANEKPGADSTVNRSAATGPSSSSGKVEEKFDPRESRPLAVKVSITLHDIHGHLVKVI